VNLEAELYLMSKLAIDFDSTLCDKNWNPIPDSVKWTHWLSDLKYELYICTSRPREDWLSMRHWLKKYGFPRLRITNKKELDTIAYIDDRAIRFTNWNDIRKYFG
jgi:hypothetical protein